MIIQFVLIVYGLLFLIFGIAGYRGHTKDLSEAIHAQSEVLMQYHMKKQSVSIIIIGFGMGALLLAVCSIFF